MPEKAEWLIDYIKFGFQEVLVMKKELVKDTLIQFDVTTGKPSSADKIIEYNVNMNVSLSNEKKSRIFQMTQSLVIIILAITFLIAYTQLKTEIRILQAQVCI